MNDVTLTYNCVRLDLIGNAACLVFPAIMILDSLIIYLHFPALFAYVSKLLILYAVVLLQPVPYFEYLYFYKFRNSISLNMCGTSPFQVSMAIPVLSKGNEKRL